MPGSDGAAFAATARKLLADNISTLRRHKVATATGSHEYSETSPLEVKSLAQLGTLDNLTSLDIWLEPNARGDL